MTRVTDSNHPDGYPTPANIMGSRNGAQTGKMATNPTYNHRFLIVELYKEYSVEETHALANAIMQLEKVMGITAAQVVKKVK